MRQRQNDLIIFLTTGKIFLSDGNRIFQFEVPASAIRDWDLVDKSALQDTMTAFVNANRLEPSDITFILAGPACFSQDITTADPTKINEETEKFLNAIPFNYIISRVYKIGGGVRVVAANKDLVDAIAEVFEGKGFPLYAVVPEMIFPEVGVKPQLDIDLVKVVLGSRQLIDENNMITPKPIAPEIAAATAPPKLTTTKASSGYLPYLIGVAAVAIIALILLVIFMKP